MFRLTLVPVLVLLGLLVAAPATDADHPGEGGYPLSTTLTGAAEVPGPGDPDGSGTADLRLNPGQEEICFDLTATGIDPATGAHIHIGGTTSAGPIVVHLVPPTDGSSSGCVYAPREVILQIIHNPENYYVNVHNAAYPRGALRGQLGV